MNKYIKYTISLIVILGIGTIFYNKVYIPKTTFEMMSPSVGNLKVNIKGIGNVGAKDIYSITAQTGGKILQINTDQGQWVKKGELLIVMDGVDLPQQLEVMRATLQRANYDIKAAINELTNLKAQSELLEITYKRYTKLKEQKFASQAEYDKAKTDFQSIQASVSTTKSRIESAKATRKIAQKNVEVIEAKIARLKVYAPINGYVIAKEAEVAQDVIPSVPILKIVDASTLWVEAKIDERISSKIKVGQSASIVLRSKENIIYPGFVKRIDAMSDAVTLQREVDIAFGSVPIPFFINEQAQVSIDIEVLKNVIKIPSKVVVQNGGKLGVWIAKENHAYFKAIKIIAQNDTEIAVKNLSVDTKILLLDKNKKPLKDGMKIHK